MLEVYSQPLDAMLMLSADLNFTPPQKHYLCDGTGSENGEGGGGGRNLTLLKETSRST